MPDPVLSARSRYTATRQHHGDHHEATAATAADFAAARIAAYIERTVSELGAPSSEQAERIAALLRPVASEGRAAG